MTQFIDQLITLSTGSTSYLNKKRIKQLLDYQTANIYWLEHLKSGDLQALFSVILD